MAKNEVKVPSSVLVHGQQCPVKVDKGKIKTEIKDPLGPVKHSPFPILPATNDWVHKYGGSDVSIVAYNVSVLLKGQKNANDKGTGKGEDSNTD